MLVYIGVNGWITRNADDEASRAFSDGDHGAPVIASPVPLAFWERETIRTRLASDPTGVQVGPVYRFGRWSLAGGFAGEAGASSTACVLPDLSKLRSGNSQADAFLFWSRAPFATRATDGSVILYDARFYDPRARDRFSVALPDVKCEPMP